MNWRQRRKDGVCVRTYIVWKSYTCVQRHIFVFYPKVPVKIISRNCQCFPIFSCLMWKITHAGRNKTNSDFCFCKRFICFLHFCLQMYTYRWRRIIIIHSVKTTRHIAKFCWGHCEVFYKFQLWTNCTKASRCHTYSGALSYRHCRRSKITLGILNDALVPTPRLFN